MCVCVYSTLGKVHTESQDKSRATVPLRRHVLKEGKCVRTKCLACAYRARTRAGVTVGVCVQSAWRVHTES